MDAWFIRWGKPSVSSLNLRHFGAHFSLETGWLVLPRAFHSFISMTSLNEKTATAIEVSGAIPCFPRLENLSALFCPISSVVEAVLRCLCLPSSPSYWDGSGSINNQMPFMADIISSRNPLLNMKSTDLVRTPGWRCRGQSHRSYHSR